ATRAGHDHPTARTGGVRRELSPVRIRADDNGHAHDQRATWLRNLTGDDLPVRRGLRRPSGHAITRRLHALDLASRWRDHREGAQRGSRSSRRHAVGLHARLGGFSGREPPFDLGDVALWITCERPETSGAAEGVLALWPLEDEALFALLGDVHDHVADRVEHLSISVHPPSVDVPRPG